MPVLAPPLARSASLSNARMRPRLLIDGLRLGPSPAVIGWLLAGAVDASQICAIPVSIPVAGSLVEWKAIDRGRARGLACLPPGLTVVTGSGWSKRRRL